MIFPILLVADETSAEIHIMSFPQHSQTSNCAAICVPSSSTTMQGHLNQETGDHGGSPEMYQAIGKP